VLPRELQSTRRSISACEHYAGNEKTIAKALKLQADKNGAFDVTIDLEDGAPSGTELAHAQWATEVLARPRQHRLGLRIHGPGNPHWIADANAIRHVRPDYLVIPKVRSAADVIGVRDFVGQPDLPLHVLIETHEALRDAFAIAAIPEVESLDFGLMDFVSDHGGALSAECMRSPLQFEHALIRRAKAEICAAALAHGKVPTHNVTLDVKTAAQAEDDARRAHRDFGFLRMWSIHPIQIDAILAGMAPSSEEISTAIAILTAAQAKSWGPIEHEGRLHDRASYRYWLIVLERAQRAGLAIGEAAALL
jgi:citrate lyase subunit beta / citryl-CoA lyase